MPFCLVKNYLTQNNFQFKDINVAQDQQAAQEMVQKSGQMGYQLLTLMAI